MWGKTKDDSNVNISADDIKVANIKIKEAQEEIDKLIEYKELFCPIIVNTFGKDGTHHYGYSLRHNQLLLKAINDKILSIEKELAMWTLGDGE